VDRRRRGHAIALDKAEVELLNTYSGQLLEMFKQLSINDQLGLILHHKSSYEGNLKSALNPTEIRKTKSKKSRHDWYRWNGEKVYRFRYQEKPSILSLPLSSQTH